MGKQMSDFARFPVDTQYAVYLCGNQIIHPPAMHLATPFAAEGAAIVPLLRQKLSQARDDVTIRDIVRVLTQMQVQKTYDVRGDRQLMELMNSSIAGMRDPEWPHHSRHGCQDAGVVRSALPHGSSFQCDTAR